MGNDNCKRSAAMRPPLIYQVNTRVWLYELSGRLGRPAKLDDIPEEFLERMVKLGFGWVWLLGIWKTGPAGRRVSAGETSRRQACKEALGDSLREEDICGSPFAVRDYVVQPDFGGEEALDRLRTRMHQHGLRLMLDVVPNHTALDHPWATERPELYVHGTEDHLREEPQNYIRLMTGAGEQIFAHGRDPFFDGWRDTLQLDYRRPEAHMVMREQLIRIAGQCDGLRCDMAMLILPDVFHDTWARRSIAPPAANPAGLSFWPQTIESIRRQHPDFLFMAEVYWDREWEMLQQGFDCAYDKGLYDRLAHHSAECIRNHLMTGLDYQRKLVRFLENHDEPRAARVFGSPAQHRAAAVVAFLAPGYRLFHEGQLEGRRVKASIHLRRRLEEAEDRPLKEFYESLLGCLGRVVESNGRWQLLECGAVWKGNEQNRQFIAFVWEGSQENRLLITVNYAAQAGECYVRLPFPDLMGKWFRLQDLLSARHYWREGKELSERGLYLKISGWDYHVFDFSEAKILAGAPGLRLRGPEEGD